MPGGSAFGRLGSPKCFLPAYTSETQGRPPGWERRASSRDALLRYTIPISQSIQKTELLLGGRPEEF